MTCAVVIISLLQYRIFGPPAIRTVRYPGYFRLKVPMGSVTIIMKKTWFIRCRNITLGYNIPIKTSKHILSNVRVYFDVNNPFTITPYTGLDRKLTFQVQKVLHLSCNGLTRMFVLTASVWILHSNSINS